MAEDFISRVSSTIEKYSMIREGDAVLAGVSGGADSVALLAALDLIRKKKGGAFTLKAVHVHHGLRKNADGDEAFVRGLCKERGIPCVCAHVDVAGDAAAHGTGIEEEGRAARYRIFRREAENEHSLSGRRTVIATAHHREDNAETVLFHLCRGCSLQGAAGIRPVQGDLVRPLLFEDRPQIEGFLAKEGISFRTDESNADSSFARNYLRNIVFPGLAAHVNAESADHFAAFAEKAAEVCSYLEDETQKAFSAAVQQDGNILRIRRENLLHLAPLMQGRVIYEALSLAAGGRKDLTSSHVDALLQLTTQGRGGRMLNLPGGVLARYENNVLSIYCGPGIGNRDGAAQAEKRPPAGENALRRGENTESERGTQAFREEDYPLSAQAYRWRIFKVSDLPEGWSVPRNEYTKWFDYDTITAFPAFRTRQPGDYIVLDASGAVKKTARCMIDAKVPGALRGRIVMPADGREILWIPGCRISETYKITEKTSVILEITIVRGGPCERG